MNGTKDGFQPHLVMVLLAALVCGCGDRTSETLSEPRRISLAEFSSNPSPRNDDRDLDQIADESPASSDSTEMTSSPMPIHLGARSNDAGDLSGGVDPAEVEPRPSVQLSTPGDQALVDSLIGQINGRPIFADEVLLPVEDELVAKRRESATLQEFVQQARTIVVERMRAVVINELFLAEAESSLSSDQQRGVIAFLRTLREQEIAKRGGGSKARAEEELMQEEGIQLEQYLEQSKNEALIRDIVFRKIRDRVIVSWRDIEREYNRRYDEFNPPPTITLSRIRFSMSETEKIREVKDRLAAGEEFGSIAEALGIPDRGLWSTFPLGQGGITDIDINEDYKPYLEGLEVGDTTEPIEIRQRTMWFHVTSIDREEGLSLYDEVVQEQLRRQLFMQRWNEEHNRYISNLLEKSTMDNLSEMVDRALAIALRRYGT